MRVRAVVVRTMAVGICIVGVAGEVLVGGKVCAGRERGLLRVVNLRFGCFWGM